MAQERFYLTQLDIQQAGETAVIEHECEVFKVSLMEQITEKLTIIEVNIKVYSSSREAYLFPLLQHLVVRYIMLSSTIR